MMTFTACCLVSKWDEYRDMKESMLGHGFNETNTVFLTLDNSDGNRFDAFQALRYFLRRAETNYILILHQDVRFVGDGYQRLGEKLRELEGFDPHWAVAGNAGKAASIWGGALCMNVNGQVVQTSTDFPSRVFALDENFLIVKGDAGLTVSRDLQGYHFYGAELCDVARRLGYGSYVIDFLVRHDSKGNLDEGFFLSRKHLEEKYRAYRALDRVATTCTELCWSESYFRKIFALAHSVILLDFYRHPQAREARTLMLRLFASSLPAKMAFLIAEKTCLSAKFITSLPEEMLNFYKSRIQIVFWRIRREIQWWSRNWRSRIFP